MGETYWGDLELDIPEHLPAPRYMSDGTPYGDMHAVIGWDLAGWMTTTFGTTDEEVLSMEQRILYETVVELLEEIDSWLAENEMIGLDERTIQAGGEHSYGIAHWTNNFDLEETCEKHGIAYRMWDDGKYEIPGEERAWSPDGGYKARGHSAAGTVLPGDEAEALWKAAGEDFAAFGAAVRDYFA